MTSSSAGKGSHLGKVLHILSTQSSDSWLRNYNWLQVTTSCFELTRLTEIVKCLRSFV